MDYRIEQLRFQVREDPSSRHFYQLGELLRRHGELDEAIEVLRAGLEHHREYVAAWVSLGRALFQSERYGEARPAFSRALELDPENAVAATMLGRAAARAGDWNEAAEALTLAATLVPSDEDLAAEAEAARSRLEPEGDGEEEPETAPSAAAREEATEAPGPVEPVAAGGDGESGAAEAVEEGGIPGGESMGMPTVPRRTRELAFVSEEDPWLVIPRGDTGVFQVGDDVFTVSGTDEAMAGARLDEGAGFLEEEPAEPEAEGEAGIPEEIVAGAGPAVEEEAEPPVAAAVLEEEVVTGPEETAEPSGAEAPGSTGAAATVLPGGEIPLPTATLARLALEQGDLPLAEETARAVLKRDPGSMEAREVLESIAKRRSEMAASPATVARRKIERLEEWLEQVRRAATARAS